MKKLKKIGVLSFALIQALIGVFIGLIFGLLYIIVGFIAGLVLGTAGWIIFGVGVISIITAPIVSGIFGFLAGAVIAFLYNLSAKWTGGVELEFNK